MLGQPDVILDLLVRRDPADEEEVDELVVQDLSRAPAAATGLVMRDSIDGQRQHAGRREAERLELLPVVLGDAERQIDAADQRRQLLPRQRGQAEQRRIVGREERAPA